MNSTVNMSDLVQGLYQRRARQLLICCENAY